MRLRGSKSRAKSKDHDTLREVFLDQFIGSHSEPPAEQVLDFDATDDRVHGMQEGCAFHAYGGRGGGGNSGGWRTGEQTGASCRLYVFCGERLLCAYLRRSNADAARHWWAVLKLLVTRLRAAW